MTPTIAVAALATASIGFRAEVENEETLMATTEITVRGMVCDACAGHVRKSLEAVPGVQSVRVDREGGRAAVEHAEVARDELLAAVARAGYEAEIA